MILYVKSSNGFIAQYGLEIQLPANFTDFPFIIIPVQFPLLVSVARIYL